MSLKKLKEMQQSGSMALFQIDKPVLSNAPPLFFQVSKTSKLPLLCKSMIAPVPFHVRKVGPVELIF
jgi:hypothetical protein